MPWSKILHKYNKNTMTSVNKTTTINKESDMTTSDRVTTIEREKRKTYPIPHKKNYVTVM